MLIRLVLLLFLFLLVNFSNSLQFENSKLNTKSFLYKSIDIPKELLIERKSLLFGGDIRVGDLQNNKQIDFVVYRSANSVNGGATQPCFIGAFTQDGKLLWSKGRGGYQPNRPGPVAIHDIDGDGKTEVITLFADNLEQINPFSMEGVSIQILDGETGIVKKEVKNIELIKSRGKGPNWVHQRILIANLRGLATPQDFIIKLGTKVIAFDNELNVLWTYSNKWDEYGECPAYVPAIGDINNDGKDEVNGGYYLLNSKGEPMWEKKLGKNMDAVVIDYWDDPNRKRVFASGFGHVLDEFGNIVLKLGNNVVPHGQELRVGKFDSELSGNQMVIRYNGHNEEAMLVNNTGEVLYKFMLNFSPNNTGMETVYWNGSMEPAFLYNGGALWNLSNGKSEIYCNFPDLIKPPVGGERQGWYHCIPIDVIGDDGEEIILYNPWESKIFIYSSKRKGWNNKKPYNPTSKQYNVRLMD